VTFSLDAKNMEIERKTLETYSLQKNTGCNEEHYQKIKCRSNQIQNQKQFFAAYQILHRLFSFATDE